ncbi:MAG: adenylate kinase [Gemmatimonadota bacterium]|nr:MAG: adenylate kinase [Gemmatimonadota bacterium]
MVWIFLGPPGAGKGTQAVLLAEHLGIPHVSTGELLRRAMRNGTELGKKAKSYMDAGDLVPDPLILELVREVLAGAKGCILDGFPRNIAQADVLGAILKGVGLSLTGVLRLDVPDEMLVARIAGRAREESRADDSEATVRNRLKVYAEQTAPLVEYYRRAGKLVDVNGEGSIREIQTRIREIAAEAAGGTKE